MIALYIVAFVFIISPFLPATGHPHWFFRTADFVRLQSIAIEIVILITILIFADYTSWFDLTIIALLLFAIIYQVAKVFKYSSLRSYSKPDSPTDARISILAGNVLQTNTNYDGFIKIIKKYDPDVVLAMETDKNWEKALETIEETYTYNLKAPNDKFYGMHLYSKIPLENAEINYLIEDHVPSMQFECLVNNLPIHISCLHPAPPSPTENKTSKERDAELIITAKKLRELDQPMILIGDMNDVVWSRVTRLFKKITGMRDPRVGRGFFSTYHAGYKLMRFPLDHIFHSEDLYVGKMERSDYYGSDHFAMYYEIHHLANASTQVDPNLDSDDEELMKEVLDRIDIPLR